MGIFVLQHNKKGDLWVVIDSKIFDLSKFVGLHPGGEAVLRDEEIAGKDATEAFFGLHRHEVLLTPRYARLQIGTVQGQKQLIPPPASGSLSLVPYAEPTWLSKGYHSPYYNDSHRKFQAWFRKFIDDVVIPDAQEKEQTGKYPSAETIDFQA